MTTIPRRDPRTLAPAPQDESWRRGAALIDGAAAAMLAMMAERRAAQTIPTPIGADEAGRSRAASARIATTSGTSAIYPDDAPGSGKPATHGEDGGLGRPPARTGAGSPPHDPARTPATGAAGASMAQERRAS
jgi:hypothetical protein